VKSKDKYRKYKHNINKFEFLFRYFAICQPLCSLSQSFTSRAKRINILIWLISFISATPWALFTKVNYLTYNGKMVEESAWCSMAFTEDSMASLYTMLGYTVVFYLAPMALLVALYAR
jgi:neuromedin U receptor 1